MIDLSLLEDFVTGAGESLDEMETALLELESNPTDNELINTIFRAMHTIKGAAQFVGLEKVSALSHVLEDLLDLMREGKKDVTSEIIDLIIQVKDRISTLTNDLERTQTELTDVDDLVQLINIQLGVEPPVIEESTETIEEECDDLSAFLSEEEEEPSEDLSSFLSEDNEGDDLGDLFSEELTQETVEEESNDLSSFLSEDPEEETTDNLSDFLTEDEESEDVDAFLSEEPEEEATDNLSDFLSEEADEATIQEAIEALEKPPEEAPVIDEKPEPVIENTQIDAEFIVPDEEYDQELFGIYILQLQEKFALINDYLAQLESANNPEVLLSDTLDALESLKFSANYMAYDKLTHFYARWIESILEAQDELSLSNDISFSFMHEYQQKLQQIFPQLQDIADSTLTHALNTPDDTPELVDILEPNAPELAFVADLVQPENTPVVNEEIEILEAEIPLTNEVIDEDEDEEEDLFNRLSNALEISSIESAITSEPINEVFGSLLATTAEIQSEPKPELKLEVKTLAEANQEPEPKPTQAKPVTEKIEEQAKTDTQPKKPTQEKATTAPEKVFKKSIRVDADKIDSLMNQVGELIVDRAYFFQLANEINELQQHLKNVTGLGQKDLKPVRTFAYRFSEAIISLGRTSNELQEGVMKVRMLPIAQIFNRYPRLIHDLSHSNNKKVKLEVRGEETELDKMIIEEIADPLIHMIRNAIGHGIESPEERLKVGKPEEGHLLLEAYHESNHIVIELSDDGKGIDADRIREKAEALKLFTKEELARMSNDDLTRFIMMPGFSTAKEINSTSGRGVGMDVVKKNIEKLNGTIEVESEHGVGTKMRLKIPLTLAIIPALLVLVGDDYFTIPLANVEETLRVEEDEISIMEETEVMYLRGKTLPIFRLSTLFKIDSIQQSTGKSDFFVVVVNVGNQRIGLMVDALVGQEEVVIKPLADYLHEGNCFSGATIIGDGRISLILDVYELINMTTEQQVQRHHTQEQKSLSSLETES